MADEADGFAVGALELGDEGREVNRCLIAARDTRDEIVKAGDAAR